MGSNIDIAYEKIYELYVIDKLSGNTIADILHISVSTVYNKLRKFNIPRRDKSEAGSTNEMKFVKSMPGNKIYHSKQWLMEEYINKQKSANELANETNVCIATIFRWLKYYSIPIRNIVACHKTDRFRSKRSGNNSSSKLDIVRNKIRNSVMLLYNNNPNIRIEISNRQKLLWKTSDYRNKQHQSRINKFNGEKNNNWKGGISFEPYCPKFNKEFKIKIRNRYNNTCFLCHKNLENNIIVHHIDYNKNSICNGHSWAFITLCRSCHTKTNFNRWFWFNLLINNFITNQEINFRKVEFGEVL